MQLDQDAEITPYLNSRRLLDLEPTSAVVVTAQWRFSQRQGRWCSLMYDTTRHDSQGGATMPGAGWSSSIGRSPSMLRPREGNHHQEGRGCRHRHRNAMQKWLSSQPRILVHLCEIDSDGALAACQSSPAPVGAITQHLLPSDSRKPSTQSSPSLAADRNGATRSSSYLACPCEDRLHRQRAANCCSVDAVTKARQIPSPCRI